MKSETSKSSDEATGEQTEQTSRRAATRRGVLTGAVALGSTALLGSASGGLARMADPNPETGSLNDHLQALDATGRQQAKEGTSNPTDVDILNYALTLEHLEYAFYRDGLKEFSDDELMNANALDSFGETVRMEVPKYLAEIRDNEKAHVDTITKTVKKLGGKPAMEGEYDFGYKTPSEFLATGKALENTGVSAYAGAAPMIMSNKVLSAALSIHTVEARHASFLNFVNTTSPFPKAFDEAKSMKEVLKIASQFIESTEKTKQENKNTEKKRDSDGKSMLERKKDDGTSDLDVLNYALTLEHLEYAFYRDGLKEFSDSELENAVLCRFGNGEVTNSVGSRLAAIRDHEKAHVDAKIGRAHV